MDKEYIIEKLRSFAGSAGLSIDDGILSEVIAISSFRVISRGMIISSIGDDTALSGLVLSGMVRSYYIDDEGNDMTRGFAPAGYMCMDDGFFGYPERICMWETLEESTVMFCETAEIKKLIRENVPFKDVWISLLENAIRYKLYRENGFLVENAAQRYIHFRKQFPELCEKVPQKHIATYLGIAPESLSRIRSSLREENG
ncbi:MAG: Crp/Fnr family transcriptional regulator [Ruminococcus sp.]|nr:Crp/Fnr family transcriptional regulator [Ruminococcus sp.]